MEILIENDKIEIRGYSYYNFFYNQRCFEAGDIDFIKIEINLIWICINSKEILFIPVSFKIKIEEFIQQHNVKTNNSLDVWELICFPFVDTARSEEELSENMKQLNNLSFKKEEVERIRKKVSTMMLLYTVMTMEWVSLELSDVIQARKNIYFFMPFYKKFYFWAMQIAIRGFEMQNV